MHFLPALDYEKSITAISLRGHYKTFSAPMFGFVGSTEERSRAKKFRLWSFYYICFNTMALRRPK